MSVKNTESKCNLDINIRKSTHVTSEMHGYGVLDIRAWLNCLAFFTFPSALAFVLLRAALSGDCQRQCSMRAAGDMACVNYSQSRNPLTTISVICLERASGCKIKTTYLKFIRPRCFFLTYSCF